MLESPDVDLGVVSVLGILCKLVRVASDNTLALSLDGIIIRSCDKPIDGILDRLPRKASPCAMEAQQDLLSRPLVVLVSVPDDDDVLPITLVRRVLVSLASRFRPWRSLKYGGNPLHFGPV